MGLDEILRHAHFVGSTKKLLAFVQNDPARTFIIGTEPGIEQIVEIGTLDHPQDHPIAEAVLDPGDDGGTD